MVTGQQPRHDRPAMLDRIAVEWILEDGDARELIDENRATVQ
jgi:hypothetical protein